MKCALCGSSLIFFTVMPLIDERVGWSSHVLVEREDKKLGLYHYQCASVDVLPIYEMFLNWHNERETDKK